MASREPTFGEFLYEARQTKGLSLRQAAKLIGTTHGRVNEMERMIDGHTGKPFVPSYTTVVRVARAYGLSPSDLLVRAGYEPLVELDDDERELLHAYRALAEDRRGEARESIRRWLEGGGP